MTDWAAVRERPHYVYRLLGKRGRLLYVGCSVNPQGRVGEWRRSGNVGPLMAKVEVIGPLPFDEARRFERHLIEQSCPPFNIEWTPRHRRGYSPYTSRRRVA